VAKPSKDHDDGIIFYYLGFTREFLEIILLRVTGEGPPVVIVPYHPDIYAVTKRFEGFLVLKGMTVNQMNGAQIHVFRHPTAFEILIGRRAMEEKGLFYRGSEQIGLPDPCNLGLTDEQTKAPPLDEELAESLRIFKHDDELEK